jgi:recombination protein RecR
VAGKEIEKLIKSVAKLPALGTRSARRIVLHLLKKRETSLEPLLAALQDVSAHIRTCHVCGNFDTEDPCPICTDPTRDHSVIAVVQDVADLWAMERVGFYKGGYHVLGGILSALEGITPEDLNIESLFERIRNKTVEEVILALPATVDGQITTHYLLSRLKEENVKVTTLAQGIPVGAELDYMDDGTIQLALSSRKPL